MGFTKPYTYADNAVLSATNHASNEDALREYVNQEITASDVGVDTFVGESIATPRLITSVQTGDFVSKTLQGVSKPTTTTSIYGSPRPLRATIKQVLRLKIINR